MAEKAKKPRVGDLKSMEIAELLESENHEAAVEAAKAKVSTVGKSISLYGEGLESHNLLNFPPRARQIIHGYISSLRLNNQVHSDMLEHAGCWLAPWERNVMCWREFFRQIREFGNGEALGGSGNGVLQAFLETSTGDRFKKEWFFHQEQRLSDM